MRLLVPELFHPNLQFRYSIFSSRLPNAFFSARAATQPSFDTTPLELSHGNGSFYVKGKVKWNPITITCYQFEGITIQDFWTYMQTHQIVATATDFRARAYKHDLRLSLLTPAEIPLGTWVLHDAFYESVNFGSMDRSSDEVAEVTATIRYDYAIYKTFI